LYLTETETPYFRRLGAPTREELQSLVELIAQRVGRQLERRGLLRLDAESSHLTLEPSGEEEEGLAVLQSHSITYRIAVGAQRGRKAFILQSLPPRGESERTERVAQASGF